LKSFAQYLRRWRLGLGLLLVACILGLGSLALALDVPPYKGYVNDYADMISPQEEMKLERALQSFELTDSTQVAILTIPSLEGDSLEDFSIRTVDQWKVGQKGKDNGVLLLVAKNDRKIRIEVGRGLEPVLTDLLSGVNSRRTAGGQGGEGPTSHLLCFFSFFFSACSWLPFWAESGGRSV
jgi:uncharacterized membrane protein YgcG